MIWERRDQMGYSLQIGLRYLRSKKRSTISAITSIAIVGVALGVASLLAVLSVTGGFEKEFRDRVVGVNAHVLVLKHGVDFDEYRDVVRLALEMPEVAGAEAFWISPMLIAKGDRVTGVLVKGVDPEHMPSVLDLPEQIVQGSLSGLRREGAAPPVHPDRLGGAGGAEWEFLETLRDRMDAQLEAGGALDEGEPGGLLPGEPLGPDEPSIGEDGLLDEVDQQRLIDHILASDGGFLSPDGGLPSHVRRHIPVWERERLIRPDGGGQAADGGDAGQRAMAAEGGPAAPPSREYEPLPEVEVASPEQVEAWLDGMDPSALDDLSPEQEEQLVAEELELERREAEGIDALPGIVLGRTLAREVAAGVGDRVTLFSSLSGLDLSMIEDGAGPSMQSRDFRVIALFEAGFQEYDSELVYTDLYEAQHFQNRGDSVTGVEIRVHELDSSLQVARRLERELAGPFYTLDWAELNHGLFTALQLQKVIIALVTSSIVFVAAFMVIATLIMIVIEKKREIAILKAMGAGARSILTIFIVQGTIIGVIGTLLGLLVGGGVCLYLDTFRYPLDPAVYRIDHLPVLITPLEFLITLVVSLVICTTATIAPSFWAARMLPVDGLRYE